MICLLNDYIMGKNSSKIKDLLFVTGSDLDPPAQTEQRKMGSKEVKIDYRKFVPKSYYKKDATDHQIEEQLAKVEKKEAILKQFKYFQDFDRIDFKQMDLQAPTFEILVEQGIKLSAFFSLVAARLFQVQRFNDYFTVAGMYRMFLPLFGIGMAALMVRFATSPEYHIINHEYFRMIPREVAIKQEFELNLNFYKDVEDIKYNYKYPSAVDYYRTKRDVMDRNQLSFKAITTEYYQYVNGLKMDKYEEFLKQRAEERKQNSQAITPEELQQISKEVGSTPI